MVKTQQISAEVKATVSSNLLSETSQYQEAKKYFCGIIIVPHIHHGSKEKSRSYTTGIGGMWELWS